MTSTALIALEIITAGRTGPNRSVRFGGDLSLDDRGRRDIGLLADTLGRPPVTLSGPDAASRESAALLGDFVVDDGLATLDIGSWWGRAPEQIDPAELGLWFGDPASCPHGGERVTDFIARIREWHEGITRSDVCDLRIVVTMPVAQALLAGDAAGFFGVEVRPAARYMCGC